MTMDLDRSLELRFRSGAASIRDLQEELAAALTELADPASDMARTASELGIASHEFARSGGSVDQAGKGFGDAVIVVAIFAPAANHALRNVWDELIWPRLKSRLGADALGDILPDDDGDHDDSGEDAEE
jgi:hypothetical protein